MKDRQPWNFVFSIAIAAIVCILTFSCSRARHAPAPVFRKKIIATGWDSPSTSELRMHWRVYDTKPFDGLAMHVIGDGLNGAGCHVRAAFHSGPWRRAWFSRALSDIEQCSFEKLKTNFVYVGANPGDVDWFDDTAWRNVAEHWAIAAWFARTARLKGIVFDPEAYTPPFQQFNFRAQKNHSGRSFADYQLQARRRGREVMAAVAREYPDITILCYFMHSTNSHARAGIATEHLLQQTPYGLYPSFIDGWLDRIPPTLTLVDGCEMAYDFISNHQFESAALDVKQRYFTLIAPENARKYRAHVQVGFGLYLDNYLKNLAPSGGNTQERRFSENLSSALNAADEYIWIYGETFRWWPTSHPNVSHPRWDEILPWITPILEINRDPAEFARGNLERGAQRNLIVNGDFANDLTGWTPWQATFSQGSFSWDPNAGATKAGCVRTQNIINGCLTQKISVAPLERYFFTVSHRNSGNGVMVVRIRWQDVGGEWLSETADKMFFGSQSDEWSRTLGAVQVPSGARTLVLLLMPAGQLHQGDFNYFDDIALFKAP